MNRRAPKAEIVGAGLEKIPIAIDQLRTRVDSQGRVEGLGFVPRFPLMGKRDRLPGTGDVRSHSGLWTATRRCDQASVAPEAVVSTLGVASAAGSCSREVMSSFW